MNAFGTSQCYQWVGVSPATSDDFRSDAIAACQVWVSKYYATYPWAATSWAYEGVEIFDVFPSYKCKYQYATSGNSTVYHGSIYLQTRANPAGCKVFVSSFLQSSAQCGPACNGLGDPINPANGGVYGAESDAKSQSNSIGFKRFYNSADSNSSYLSAGWRHSFSRSIKPVYSSSTYKPYLTSAGNSSQYTDEATACTSGFVQIKSQVSEWALATASYSNGVCSLSVGSTNIGTLSLLYTSPPTPAPGTTSVISYDATRDDGQVVSFGVSGSAIVAPPSIGLNLQQTSGGYALTDASDNVESYDANGKLLSVTSRTGVIQTMSYDSAGRLSSVTDNFGHSLILSYDSQGRLSTATRQ